MRKKGEERDRKSRRDKEERGQEIINVKMLEKRGCERENSKEEESR